MNDIMINSTSLINIRNPKFIPKLKMPKPEKSIKPDRLFISDSLNLSNDQHKSPNNNKIHYNAASFTININPIHNQTERKENTSLDMIYGYNALPKDMKIASTSQNRWTKQEDEQLMQIVNRIGAKQWRQVASLMKTKTAKQCRDHYTNCLDPEIKSSYWSNEEEKILLSKYEQFGPHWSLIKNFLPGRTTLMIKNYVKMLLKKNSNISSQKEEYESASNSSDKDQNDFDSSSEESKETQQNDPTIYDINYLLNRPSTFNAYV